MKPGLHYAVLCLCILLCYVLFVRKADDTQVPQVLRAVDPDIVEKSRLLSICKQVSLHVSMENQMWQKRHTPCLLCTEEAS